MHFTKKKEKRKMGKRKYSNFLYSKCIHFIIIYFYNFKSFHFGTYMILYTGKKGKINKIYWLFVYYFCMSPLTVPIIK